MKKIILTLILFISFMPSILAEKYIWSDKKIDDLELIEEEKRFRYYKEIRNGEYIKKGVEDERYNYEEKDNIEYRPSSDYKDNCSASESVIVEYQKVYPYQNIYRSRYLRLWSIPEDLNIEKINIYQDNQKIDFDIVECKYCQNFKIGKDGYIKLDLGKEYAPRSLKLEIITSNSNRFFYLMTFYTEEDRKAFEIGAWSTEKAYTLKYYGFENHLLSEIKYSTAVVENDYETYVLPPKEMCIEKEVYTYRYNISKKYYDLEYHTYLAEEDYIKDEEDYLIFYKYLVEDNETVPKEEETVKDENILERPVVEETNFQEVMPADTGLSKEYKNQKRNNIIKILAIYILLFSILSILIIQKIKNKMSK